MSDTQRIAELAQRLLKDETVQEVLAMMRDEAIHRWEQGQSPEARDAAWHDREAVKRFERNLQALADRGVVEQIVEQRRK